MIIGNPDGAVAQDVNQCGAALSETRSGYQRSWCTSTRCSG